MRSGLEYNDTQPLILELLTKRNRFDSKQLFKIEEALRGAGAGTLPEAALIRGGFISDLEVANIFAEDMFLTAIDGNVEADRVDKEPRRTAPRKALRRWTVLPHCRARRGPRHRVRLPRGNGGRG